MERDKLIAQIDADADSYFESGRLNNVSDLVCSMTAIAASFLAAVLAFTGAAGTWVTGAVAAIPAACATLQRVVDFRGRASWYFVFAARIRPLSRSLTFDEKVAEQEVSKYLGEIEVEMEERWARMVQSNPASPNAASRSAAS